MKIALVSGAVGLLILSAVLWLFVLQPEQQDDAQQAEMWLAYGIELFERKEYEEALKDLQNVPAGSAQEGKARYYQGSAHLMLKDYESAADYLQQALVLDTQNAGTLYALGVIYFKLGNTNLAKSYFASVLEINPDDEQAKGLMDIMAGLERQSVAESEGEDTTESQ